MGNPFGNRRATRLGADCYILDQMTSNPHSYSDPLDADRAAKDLGFRTMHDWTLISLHVEWKSGELRIELKSNGGSHILAARGLQKLQLSRDFSWGPSVSINRVDGPTKLANGTVQLTLEIQSGDLIEIVAAAIEVPSAEQ
jgi:hypothetical protein